MNNKANGFQTFATVIFGLLIMGIIIISQILASNDESNFTFLLTGLITSTIFFFFMYSIGEIIKQLREINEKLNK